MNPVNTVAAGLVAAGAAIIGAFLGTFGQHLLVSDDEPAPPRHTRQVELMPVSVAIYASGDRLGYCVAKAHASLPNNYTDVDFQDAITRLSDRLISVLSSIGPDADPSAECLAIDGMVFDDTQISSVEFMTGEPGA